MFDELKRLCWWLNHNTKKGGDPVAIHDWLAPDADKIVADGIVRQASAERKGTKV